MTIKVVSIRDGLSSKLGWKDVRVDRNSPLGNPFVMQDNSMEQREGVIKAYRYYLWKVIRRKQVNFLAIANQFNVEHDISFVARKLRNEDTSINTFPVVKELNVIACAARTNNIRLICWCAPLECHGDVIKSCVEWINTNNIILPYKLVK